MRVIGLMSGTSVDAIDAAAADLELDGEEVRLTPLGSVSRPYPAELRAAVTSAATVAEVCDLHTRIGQAFATTAAAALDACCDGSADLVVSHGQTVWHSVVDGATAGTLQLGQPAWIAERTGLPVVADLRARDVAAGGHGAPLVSFVDALLLDGRPGVPAALNLGGIANLTIAARGQPPLAFDVGPGNALLDAAARHFAGRDCDTAGAVAASGQPLDDLLERLLADPYYARPAPKTTGKERFNLRYLLDALNGCPAAPADVLATVTQLTARTVADACGRHGVTELVVSGGGTRNPTLMAMIDAATGVPSIVSDELGLPAQDKEAYAFALLGFLTVHGVAATLPSATGARRPALLGTITPGARPLTLPAPHPRSPRALRIVR